MPPPPVTVSVPIERDVMEWDEYPGRLESKELVEVRARVSGYIDKVDFREGGIVKQGDLLFVIDPRPYEFELNRAEGEVGRAKARLALAETEFKRTKGLVPTAAASELELEERKADLAEAQAAVAVAEANAKTARLNVGFTQVRAPIGGRISRIYVTAGNLINGGEGETTLLTTIAALDPIYCYVDADERSVLRYQRLSRENKRVSARDAQIPAKLALLNETTFEHEGVIDFVDNRVDPTTGTLRARGVFANADGTMTPGLFGRLRIPGSAPYRTLLVSQAAVQADQGQHHVLTLDADNVVKITPVKLGSAFGALRAIESGLTGNERVIVNGLLRARPGGTVTPTEAPMPGADDAAGLATTREVMPTTAQARPDIAGQRGTPALRRRRRGRRRRPVRGAMKTGPLKRLLPAGVPRRVTGRVPALRPGHATAGLRRWCRLGRR
jgi:RND family efflux transporter MFP subunit